MEMENKTYNEKKIRIKMIQEIQVQETADNSINRLW